ncbi:MAG: hypothetical protein PHP52_14865, partial [Bacteroidales bacterium]|nr:hypothetical protein [Bacteroidales bacterium]
SNLASRGEKTFSIALGLENKPERRGEEKPVENPQGGTPPVLETASSVVATSQIPPATHKEKKAALPEKTYDLPPRTPPKPPRPIEAARAEAEPVLEGFLKTPSPNKSTSPKSEAECSPYVEPVEESPSMERLLYPEGSYPSSLRSRLLKIPGGKE